MPTCQVSMLPMHMCVKKLLLISQLAMKIIARVRQTNDALLALSDEEFQSCEINGPLLYPVVFWYKDAAVWLMAEFGNVKYTGKFAAFAAEGTQLPSQHM